MTLARRTLALAAALTTTVLVMAGQPVAVASSPSPVPASSATSSVAADTSGEVAPAPVTGLTAVPMTGTIRLEWTLPADPELAAVEVRRLEGSVPPATRDEGTLVASDKIEAAYDNGLDWATTYAYSVFSIGLSGGASAPVTAVAKPLDLPALSVFLAHTKSSSSIELTWDIPAGMGIDGVRIQRSPCTSPAQWVALADIGLDRASFLDTGLTPGVKYCYKANTYDQLGRANALGRSAAATVWWAYPVTDATGVSGGTSVSLSWTMPNDPSVTGVRVLRSDGVVVLDGAGTSAVDSDGVLPERTYSYTVTAYTAERHYAPAVTVRVNTALHWTFDAREPVVGTPTALDCPTTTWCMEADLSGQFQVLDGTTWSAPQRLRPVSSGPTSWQLTCPLKGWCLALGADGFQRYAAGTWAAASQTPQPPAGAYSSLTCASTTWCIAMTSDARSSVFDGSTWTAPTYLSTLRDTLFHDVSCQAVGRCFAVGIYQPTGSSWRATLVNGKWSIGSLAKPGYDVAAVDCPTSTWCIATSSWGYWTVSGTSWSARREITAGSSPDGALSCASATMCWSSSSSGGGARWNGAAWSTSVPLAYRLNRVTGLACPKKATTCHAVDDRGRHYRWTSSTGWRTQSTFDVTTGSMNEPSCVSETLCFGVDQNGWLYRWDGTSWTRPTKLFTNPAAVTCLPTGFCLAVQSEGKLYRTYANGVWSAAGTAPSTTTTGDPSCTSATACLMGDDNGAAWRFTGSGWVTAGTPFAGTDYGRFDVRCLTTTTRCMAISYDGWWSLWNGSGWTRRAPMPTDLRGQGPAVFSCAARTMCLAVVDQGATARWDGTAWTALYPNGNSPSYRLGDLDCVSADHCVGVQAYSNSANPVTWTGTGWVTGGPYGRPTYSSYVDCVSSTRCFVSGRDGVARSSAT